MVERRRPAKQHEGFVHGFDISDLTLTFPKRSKGNPK